MRAYRIAEFGAVEGIVSQDEPEPAPGPGQVLIRLHARSLNRRDLQILHEAYPVRARKNVVPVTIRRFYVGSMLALEAMLNAVCVHQLRPVIDTTFSFDEARAAYRYLAAGGHFGKIVIGG